MSPGQQFTDILFSVLGDLITTVVLSLFNIFAVPLFEAAASFFFSLLTGGLGNNMGG